MTSPRSRLRVALVAIAAVAVASIAAPTGSEPASAAQPAATVNGVAIDRSTLEETLVLLGAPAEVPGDAVRGFLTELIATEAVRQALVEAGIDVDAIEIEDVHDPGTGATIPASLVAHDRYTAALGDAGYVDSSGLEEEYEQSGSVDGVICAHVLFTPEPGRDVDDLEEAVEEIAAGADLASVAERFGLTVGGLGGGIADPCRGEALLDAALEPMLDALEETAAGEPTPVIDLDDVLVIARTPDFDEVVHLLAGDLVQDAVAGILADAEVTVDPRYGRWDDEVHQVVPLGE